MLTCHRSDAAASSAFDTARDTNNNYEAHALNSASLLAVKGTARPIAQYLAQYLVRAAH